MGYTAAKPREHCLTTGAFLVRKINDEYKIAYHAHKKLKNYFSLVVMWS